MFPETPELTEFVGADENPLSDGGNWAGGIDNAAPLKLISNTATDSAHGAPNYSYWTRNAFRTSDRSAVEVWGCTVGGQLGAALETWRVALWLDDPALAIGYLGYMGGGIGKEFAIRRYDGGLTNFTDLASSFGVYMEKLGLAINGDAVELWWYGSGTWNLALSVDDPNHRGQFYLSLGIEDPTGGGLGFVCMGGGTVRRSRIIRYVSN